MEYCWHYKSDFEKIRGFKKLCCLSTYKLSDITCGHFDHTDLVSLLILDLLRCRSDRVWTGTFRLA
jgi:hypothetical protein